MLISQKSAKLWLLILFPLALSGFTHLWNPTGFPDIFFDEGVYMRRSMNIISGGSPQEAYLYDHPYFGQILLAASLNLWGYPESLNLNENAESVENLYMAPRVLMGIIAIVDTYLIYCISRARYGHNVGFVAALLFAVMPLTWLTRRILLDSLLLPFLLLSVFLALKTRDSKNSLSLSIFSGLSLGLAVFTKIPVFVVIPVIAYLVYSNTHSKRKMLLWLIPVLSIPLLWPAYSLYLDQFDMWLHDVTWQTQRGEFGIIPVMKFLYEMDPVTIVISLAGIAYAVFRKDKLVAGWFFPFFIFLSIIGFTQYFHVIPLLPIMLISAALLINDTIGFMAKRFSVLNYQQIIRSGVVLSLTTFGIISTTIIIGTDVTGSQFKTVEYVLDNTRNNNEVTILASPVYSWILDEVYNRKNVLLDYSMIMYGPLETKNSLLVADPHFMLDIGRGNELKNIYESTKTEKTFQIDFSRFDTSVYPFTNMNFNREGSKIEVRTNYPINP